MCFWMRINNTIKFINSVQNSSTKMDKLKGEDEGMKEQSIGEGHESLKQQVSSYSSFISITPVICSFNS
jgi:hypothetical protein